MHKYTVLAVDDGPHNLQLVASILSPFYRLLLAGNGEKVMEVCIEKQPDLILLDIVLPGISGYELAEQIKAEPQTRHIPIIFLTVHTDEEAIDRAFQAGGVDYITKPFKAKELLARVKTQLDLHTAEKRLREAIDLVPYRLFAKDREGKFILANQATADFYGKKVEELLNQIEPPLPKGWKYQVTRNLKDPMHQIPGTVHTYEERLTMPDCQMWYFQTSKVAFTFSGSHLPAMLEIAIDVTEQKKREEEIQELNDQILAHSQYKDKLLSLVAHDLITYVFNTDMTLQLLLRKIDNLSKDEITKRLVKVQKNTDATQKLLSDLIAWSKTQFKSMTYTPVIVYIRDEFQNLSQQTDLLCQTKGVCLISKAPSDLQVVADIAMLRTILRNLLSNALKFSKEGDTIVLQAREKEGKILISVTDQGTGISGELLELLRKGNKEHMTTFGTQGEKGSGLGLSLIKAFIEMHGGGLEIESEQGKGSVFTFSLSAVTQNQFAHKA
ncbi:response regulator [Xanthocytophaga agilis]|uniref:histidine kinase n=1 Tax=Xanthocytophaga agilis TaxID=3048010 RepID=A0AAE3R527_9BACT|nr:response regulator [Xanthocytophaga agilis]MDJ1501732.1 response regulator [Xanthocytophaga agilis]